MTPPRLPIAWNEDVEAPMLPAPDLLEPPDDFSACERKLWSRLMPRLTQLAHVEREDIPAASEFVRAVSTYLQLTQRLRALRATQPTLSTAESAREAAHWRRTARQAAADFGLLPANRVGFALLDADGEDVELKKIFGWTRP